MGQVSAEVTGDGHRRCPDRGQRDPGAVGAPMTGDPRAGVRADRDPVGGGVDQPDPLGLRAAGRPLRPPRPRSGPDRDQADEWLARYPDDASVMAYIGRSGWNTLRVGGAIPDDEIHDAVDESYALVVAKLPKKHRPEGWDA